MILEDACNKEKWNCFSQRNELLVKIISSASFPEGFGLDPKPRMTPYHQVFLYPNEEVRDEIGEDLPSLSDGIFDLLKIDW